METETADKTETIGTETVDRETKTVDLSAVVSGIKTRLSGGRVWAYVGSLLGGLVSVSANIRHSFIVPDGRPVDWTPESMQVGFSVLGPVFLFIGLEVLARIPWYKAPRWVSWPIRAGGVLPVTVVSGFVSYQHMAGLLGYWGEDSFVQHSLPIAVDGLMVLCSAAVYITGPNFAKRLVEMETPVPVSVPRAPVSRKTPVSRSQTQAPVPAPKAPAPVVSTQSPVPAPLPAVPVPTPREATVSSLTAHSSLTTERLEMIKAAEPSWVIKLPSKARIGEIIKLPNASGTQQKLRDALKAEAAALQVAAPEAVPEIPDDARELVGVG